MAKKKKKTRRSLLLKTRLHEPTVLNKGLALHQNGNLDAAKLLYQQVLNHNPKNGDALNLAGTLALQTGDLKRARKLLQRAVEYYPHRTAYYTNLGSTLRAQGNLTQAAATFQKALRQSPNHYESLYNLASVLSEKGDFSKSTKYYRELLNYQPRHVEALSGLITALRLQGDLQEALSLCARLQEISPQPEMAIGVKGELLQIMGRHDESLTAFEKCITLAPHNAIFYNNMANTLVKMGHLHRAKDLYQQAIAKMPNLSNAYINLAWIYREYGMLRESWQCLCNLQEHAPLSPQDHSDLLFSLNYDPACNNQAMYEHAHKWWKMHGHKSTQTPHTTIRAANLPIKIGLISADFFIHPVGQFILPLLKGLPHERIISFCYSSLHTPPDNLTKQLQETTDHWRDIALLNDKDAATLITKDKIDILIDLSGHTAHNRLGVMSRKPAPTQASWLGYVNTTGLSLIDYRLTDAIADPPGSDCFYSETLYRLPHGFFCFTPPDGVPDIAPPPSAKSGITTFASFNNLPKITPEVIEVWAAILTRLPDARLLMVSHQFAEPTIKERYRKLFAQHRVDTNRLILHGSLPYLEYMALFNQVDIALDPFPHNGHTITCDTLWMGVPIITLRGNCYAGRMGSSIMTRIGLADLIAASNEEYIDLAFNLAQDPVQLNELRINMRKRLSNSLCNQQQFNQDFEQAIIKMIQK